MAKKEIGEYDWYYRISDINEGCLKAAMEASKVVLFSMTYKRDHEKSHHRVPYSYTLIHCVFEDDSVLPFKVYGAYNIRKIFDPEGTYEDSKYDEHGYGSVVFHPIFMKYIYKINGKEDLIPAAWHQDVDAWKNIHQHRMK